MGEKALWPTVTALGLVLLFIGVLVVHGTDAVQIIALFSLAGNVISLMLYGKVNKVEANTNGTIAELQRQVKDLTEYAKNSQPLDQK